MKYLIEETACYPNKYKIVLVGAIRFDDNSTCNFFSTIEDAEKEINDRRNKNKSQPLAR